MIVPKEIHLGQLLAGLPDLSRVPSTMADGPFAGVRCDLTWEGRWTLRDVTEPFVRLSDIQHVDLHVAAPIGTFTLERALATHNDFAGTVSGVCVATVLDASPIRKGERLIYRSFVRVEGDLLSQILFPGWIRDENGTSSRAWLPLRAPGRLEIDVYFVKEGPYIVVESSREDLTFDTFRQISGATRQLLSFLLAIKGDADSCDVVTSFDTGTLRHARWYPGRHGARHFYKPIPTTLPEINDGARAFGLAPAKSLLQSEVVSRCLITLLDQPGLVTPIEYLLRFGNAPVEMRGAFLSVALESLTNQMEQRGLLKTIKPLDDATWNALCEELRGVVTRASGGWTETQRKVIAARINNLNSPTNADKLSLPFKVLDVPLSDDERKAIVERNKFLHKGRLLDPEMVAGDPDAWKKAYAVEMQIYTAINKLLLKYLGYEGLVIDWGKTERETGQLAFVLLPALPS